MSCVLRLFLTARQVLEKIQSEKVERPNVREKTLSFQFPECTKLPPPVIPFSGVSFSYSGKKEDYLFENLEFGIDCDTRIALVSAQLRRPIPLSHLPLNVCPCHAASAQPPAWPRCPCGIQGHGHGLSFSQWGSCCPVTSRLDPTA